MMQVGIFGTSGMAREAGDIAVALGLSPVYITNNNSELETWTHNAPLITEEEITRYYDLQFVVGIGDPKIREALVSRFDGQLAFTNLVHPSATFGVDQREELEKSRGNIVAAGVRFTNGIAIGNFCIFNQNATVAHDSVIESFVHIAPGANISGNVHVKRGSWIGAGAVVNQGNPVKKLMIGPNTTIGSGAVVTMDCDPETVYAGVPAKRMK